MIRCAAYLRISKDGEGLGLGIDRQWQAVRELADSKGWTIDPRWKIEENSTSAWDDSKPRPGFERLLAGMESGQVEAVVVYSFDRLARRLQDTARVLSVVDKHGVTVATVTGDLDLSNAYGRGLAGILGSIANMEITQMSERLKAKAEQNARSGKVVNGGQRRYGYTTDRSALVESEAAVIRDAAAQLIAGASMSGVVRGLNDRGIGTSYGTRWTIKKLRTTLSHQALCGRVEFRGEVLRGVVGQWPAILDEETFDRAQIAMAARTRTEDRWVNHRVHLLSGLAHCGIDGCGAKMMAHMQTNDRWCYTCSARKHLGRNKALLDRYVLDEVKKRAAETFIEVPEWIDEERAQIGRRIAELEAQKAAAVRELVDNKIDASTLVAVTREYEERLADLRARQVDDVVMADRADSVVFDLDKIDSMTLAEQRAAIDLYVSSLIVLPTKRRGRGFDPTSVEIVWRDLSRMRWHATVERS